LGGERSPKKAVSKDALLENAGPKHYRERPPESSFAFNPFKQAIEDEG
jgi:hypothetical protein